MNGQLLAQLGFTESLKLLFIINKLISIVCFHDREDYSPLTVSTDCKTCFMVNVN